MKRASNAHPKCGNSPVRKAHQTLEHTKTLSIYSKVNDMALKNEQEMLIELRKEAVDELTEGPKVLKNTFDSLREILGLQAQNNDLQNRLHDANIKVEIMTAFDEKSPWQG